MGFKGSLPLKAGPEGYVADDLRTISFAARDLGVHTVALVGASFQSAGFLRWLAVIAAIYLLVLQRTGWRTNILTALLVPYIFLNLPAIIFNFLRGEVGKWFAFIAEVLHLFFPHRFPDWLEMPKSLILLLVCAPHLLADNLRSSIIGVIISLVIGAYLLQEHIRESGGFRKSFAERHGVSNTVGIILLFVSPLWELIKYF
eukprot:c6272_g1_i1 orf=139-741(+)